MRTEYSPFDWEPEEPCELPEAAWDRIRQLDLCEPARRVPERWYDTESVLAAEPLGSITESATPLTLDEVKRRRGEAKRSKKHERSSEIDRMRYALQSTGQDMSHRGRVTGCGIRRNWSPGVDGEGKGRGVGVVVGEHAAYLTGVMMCGSPWECPVCAGRICTQKAKEVRAATAAWRAQHSGDDLLLLLTLTCVHDAGDALKPMWNWLSRAISRTFAGAACKRMQERLGIKYKITSTESTHGPNGFHPHKHILLFCTRKLSPQEVREYQDFVYTRFTKYITQPNPETGKVYRTPSREHGVSLVPCHKDDYITKMGLAEEVTGGAWKTQPKRSGHRTPFQVLRDIRKRGMSDHSADAERDRAVWQEWCEGSFGRRQLVWSRGLREAVGLPSEQTDLELADAPPDDVRVSYPDIVDAETWDTYFAPNWRARVALPHAVFLASISGDWSGVVAVIDAAKGLEPIPF